MFILSLSLLHFNDIKMTDVHVEFTLHESISAIFTMLHFTSSVINNYVYNNKSFKKLSVCVKSNIEKYYKSTVHFKIKIIQHEIIYRKNIYSGT